MKHLFPILLLLAGCGRGDEGADNQAAPGATAEPAAAASAGLAGLYEGGEGPQKNQLCMVGEGDKAQFGLLVWGADLHSCSGAGEAVREGERLTLRMTGDETCTIAAAMKDGKITLPPTLPAGCQYYCGARARFSGAAFTRTGSTAADAAKARDLAGDPLCDVAG